MISSVEAQTKRQHDTFVTAAWWSTCNLYPGVQTRQQEMLSPRKQLKLHWASKKCPEFLAFSHQPSASAFMLIFMAVLYSIAATNIFSSKIAFDWGHSMITAIWSGNEHKDRVANKDISLVPTGAAMWKVQSTKSSLRSSKNCLILLEMFSSFLWHVLNSVIDADGRKNHCKKRVFFVNLAAFSSILILGSKLCKRSIMTAFVPSIDRPLCWNSCLKFF